MSKLEELIQQLCPDGVEYKRFDEACSLHARIGWQRLTRAEYKPSGDYMLITGTDFTDLQEINYDSCVYVSEERYIQDPHIQLKNGDVLITKDGTLGKVAQVNGLPKPATLNGGVFVVRCKDESLENRFIMYYLLSNHFQDVVEQQKTGSTISHLTQALFSRLLIPIPPREVQEEIVRILDKFTSLAAELQAELQARREQYEYYRNKLLTFNHTGGQNIKWMTMGEIGTLIRGNGLQKKDFTESGIGCIHYGQIYTYYGTFAYNTKSFVDEKLARSLQKVETNDLIIACTSENVEDVCKCVAWLGNETIVTGGHASIFKHNQNAKYLAYYFQTKEFFDQKKKYARGAKVIDIKRDDLEKIVIPIPSLEEQERIVNILDRFEALTNDISEGLPAEIDAVRQQYEYYRNKLLTFKKAI